MKYDWKIRNRTIARHLGYCEIPLFQPCLDVSLARSFASSITGFNDGPAPWSPHFLLTPLLGEFIAWWVCMLDSLIQGLSLDNADVDEERLSTQTDCTTWMRIKLSIFRFVNHQKVLQ